MMFKPLTRVAGNFRLCTVLLASAFPTMAGAAAAEFFVAPGGNDANPGTREAPFATIEKARDTIRANNHNQDMQADLTVWLRGGRYELNDTLVFDERDSGSNGHRIIYRALGDEIPIVCGGRKVTGWEPVAGKPYFVADVTHGFADNFHQLYVNGVRAERARSHTTIASSQADWWNDPASPWSRDGVVVRKSDIKDYTNPEDIRLLWLELFKIGDVPLLEIVPLNETEVIFKPLQPAFNTMSAWSRFNANNHFFIVNALEELDEPGEWYLDRKARKVYYYPFHRDGDLNEAAVYAPYVEVLLRVASTESEPVRHLSFQGITFQHGNWRGAENEFLGLSQAEIWKDYTSEIPGQIIINRAEDIAMIGCTVRHMGSCGIQPYEYCDNILLEGNTIYDTTAAGISIGRYWERKSNVPPESVSSNVVVRSNIIRNTGRDYMQATGLNLFAVNAPEIHHNDISDTAYTTLHARIGEQGSDGLNLHPTIGRLSYKWNRVSRAFQGHKWGIGDGGHLYMFGRYGNCIVAENLSMYANANVNFEYYSDNFSYDSLWMRNVSLASKAYREIYHSGQWNELIRFENNYILQNDPATWPEDAKAIMEKAGLEPRWRHLANRIYGHENLAEGKPSWASSEWDGLPAQRGNDGNWNTIWSTQSGGDGEGWWAVDLGAPHVIQRVCIVPRQDLYQAHMQKNIEVQASNDPDFSTYTVLCEQNEVPWYHKPRIGNEKKPTNMWEQYIPIMGGFRYLRVKSTHPTGSLNFSTFEAFGFPENPPPLNPQPPYSLHRFNEAGGTEAWDASGNARHGTYINAPTFGIAGAGRDNAVGFNGNDNHMEIPGAVSIGTRLRNVTFEAVFRTANTTSGRTLFGTWKGNSTEALTAVNFLVNGATNQHSFFIRSENARNLQADFTNHDLANGDYHHLVIAVNLFADYADRIKIYVNGVEQSLTITHAGSNALSFTDSFADLNHPFTIGARNLRGTIGLHFDGVIDEFVIHNRTLSAAGSAAAEFRYITWASGSGLDPLTNAEPGDNPDGDDLTNLQEYAFGTDPLATTGPITIDGNGNVTNGKGKPIIHQSGTTGNPMDFRAVFSRRKDHAVAGLVYTVQFSTGLDEWVSHEFATAVPILLDGSDPEIDVVYVPFPMMIETSKGFENPRFVRVGVILQGK